MILRKFHMCSPEVKLKLFRTYCTPMYTSQLWWSYKKSSINRLYISYHNIFKLFLGLSKFESTSLLCTLLNFPCCAAVIRNLVYRFMIRLELCNNVIINGILASSLYYSSRIKVHWHKLLHVKHMTL